MHFFSSPHQQSGIRLAAMALAAALCLAPAQHAQAQQTSCERMAREMRALEANPVPRADSLRRQAQRTANQALKNHPGDGKHWLQQVALPDLRLDPPQQCTAMQTRVDQLSRRVKALIAQAETVPANANPGERLAQLASAYEARGCNERQQSASTDTPLPALDGVSAPKQDPDSPVLPISEMHGTHAPPAMPLETVHLVRSCAAVRRLFLPPSARVPVQRPAICVRRNAGRRDSRLFPPR